MEKVRLYLKLVGISFKSQMQYRASFFMLSLAHFISTFVEILGIWVLFDRFKMMQGWTFEELALMYGIMHMGFALAEAMARGFDTFSQIVKNGEFDRLLLRPLGTLFQVATREIQMMRIGRFLQGFVILMWSCSQLDYSCFSQHALTILFSIIGTACFFYGLFVIQATISFWTIETLELMNIVTYGGVETGQYPMSIYQPGFRYFFTLIVPLACVAYYPIAILLQHEDFPLWLSMIFPFAGVVFLYLSCQLWKIGVRQYQSSGG